MSGDVQPRKRKDKKRKKDELSFEEPRGTSAVFGEGDVFMHSQHSHGTGGHWCAKIIFFSLLAVLVTLIGLIILENRGLSELEANAVESRYSGVLDGWIEESPSDDHHDEHTLDLKHHIDEKDNGLESENQDNEESDEDENIPYEYNESNNAIDDSAVDENSDELEEKSIEQNHDEDEASTATYRRYFADSAEINQNYELDQSNENSKNKQDADYNVISEENSDFSDENELTNYYLTQEEEDVKYDFEAAKDELERKHQDIEDYYRDEENYALENEDNDNHIDNDKNSKELESQSRSREEVKKEVHQRKYFADSAEEETKNNENDVSDEFHGEYYENYKPEKEDLSNVAINNEFISQDDANDYEMRPLEEENSKYNIENNEDDDKDDDDDNEEAEDMGVEIERIEREVSEEVLISTELPALPEQDNNGKNDPGQENISEETEDNLEETEDNDEEFLESDDDLDAPIVEHITVPAGKPFVEVDEETSSEMPSPPVTDTLAEEEEYEKQQEELRREEEQASHMWLKLSVGAALLAATHVVMRRVYAAPDVSESRDRSNNEKATTAIDRRMTLIPEETSVPATPETELASEYSKPVNLEEIEKRTELINKSAAALNQGDENKLKAEKSFNGQNSQPPELTTDLGAQEQELYSEDEYNNEENEEDIFAEKQLSSWEETEHKHDANLEGEEEIPDDVEIIDDELLEEEIEEEEISDVDDAELLSRLEAKYGRLPEPERPTPKHKDGGNTVEEEWPGEPSNPYWRQQLDKAEEELRQGAWSSCRSRLNGRELADSGRARWLAAQALDVAAEQRHDNVLLSQAITAYLHLLKMHERLSDKKILEVTERTINRIQFRGTYLSAEPVYRLLIRRFPKDPAYRNNLSTTFLMANRADLAEEVLKETLHRWPNDRLALAHYGFVLKTKHNRLEEAVIAFEKALEGDTGPANEPRFYYHLGDSLILLNRFAEAHEVHKRATALGHFLSPAQRSLYNVPRLKSRPWWNVEDTPYVKLARALENSWRDILREGEAARKLYEKEKEGLKERGDWSQLDLFVRGREIPNRCKNAPVTCSIVRAEAAAAGCRRGQVKFSSMAAGTHVRPHVGPTNCRLRMHLALSNTKNTFIRVDQETRQWEVGKVLLFDDSFEHEVWHNGTGARLVLIVDVWHPDLTTAERTQLPAI